MRVLVTGRFPPDAINDVLAGGKDAINSVIRFNGPTAAKTGAPRA